MSTFPSLVDVIGNTPLIELRNYTSFKGLNSKIYGKLESRNPVGSVKDRVANAMISAAEKSGILKKGSTIIEPSSGNTGIALAAIGKLKGYNVIITMPESMSIERQKLLKLYGAQVVLTNKNLGMQGAIDKAKELASNIYDAFIPDQFQNPVNPEVHRNTTGPEIFQDIGYDIDVFIAGVGTGGTITGVGEFLKTRKPQIKVIAVEPAGSPILSRGRSGLHKIQGIGAGFVPEILNIDIYDEVITVEDDEALKVRYEVAFSEGLLLGISSGAAIAAALKFSKRNANAKFNIVVILPDSGERYLSLN